jgi:hypothetical protein
MDRRMRERRYRVPYAWIPSMLNKHSYASMIVWSKGGPLQCVCVCVSINISVGATRTLTHLLRCTCKLAHASLFPTNALHFKLA